MQKYMSWRTILLIFALMVVVLPSPGPVIAAEEPPKAPLQISFSPSSKAGGDIVFEFSLPMVESDSLGTAGHPEVIFEPKQEGTFKWRLPTMLVFSPVKGSLSQGQHVTISINAATPLAGKEYALKTPWQAEFTVPGLRIAGKVANWPIIKGQPRFIGFLNWHTEWVGRGPLFLLYDQPVDVDEVRQQLQVTDHHGRRLEMEVYRPKNADLVLEKEIDLEYLVALRILDLPNYERSVTIQLPSWKEYEKPEILQKTLIVNTKFELIESYNTYSRYRTSSRDDGRIPLRTTWVFKFNNRFRVDWFEKALQITPQPKNVWVYGYGWCGIVRVGLQLEPGIHYRMTTDRSFTDMLGNPMGAPLDISFTSVDLAPLLTLPEGPMLLEREANRLPIQVRNIEKLEARVFRFSSPWEFARAIESGRKKNAREYGFEVKSEKILVADDEFEPNVLNTFDFPLDVAPGLLCVEVRAFGTGSESKGMLKDAILVQVTDLGITAKVFENTVLAWVTRLHDATPVEGARVTLYDDGQKVSEGITDASGVISLGAEGIASGIGLRKSIVLTAEKHGYTAVSRVLNDHLSHPWQFDLKSKVEGVGILPAAVFTDRGVYRPEETVHLKAIVNRIDVQGDEIEVQIRDPRGQQVISEILALDRFGSASYDLKLKDQAAVGEYLVQVNMGEHRTIHTFLVEEYRVPTFQVSVTSDQETWKRGKEVSTLIQAEYLHGGLLGGRTVRWEVLRQPEPFTSPIFPKYIFSLGDVSRFTGSIATGEKKLDGQGQLVVNFTPDHPASTGPMRYVMEATVTDVDRQAYVGRLSQVVHPASFYVGLLPPSRHIMAAGETLEVPIIAVKPDGSPLEGIQVQARLERIDYHTSARMSKTGTVEMHNRPVSVGQQQCEVTTQKTPVVCSFTIPEAGYYQVLAWAQDREEQMVQAGFTISTSDDIPKPDQQTVQTGFKVAVSGKTSASWPRFDKNRIELIADKSQYNIGDTAQLIVQTPYQKAQGLLTIERDGILDYRVFSINNDTPAIEVPIKAEYAPNMYVSIVLLRGRIHHKKDASGFETGAPGFKIGYAELKVKPDDQRLTIAVKPEHETVAPGRKMKIELLVHDYTGKPASGQATIMVVDEAVLGLTGYQTPDPLPHLYVERPLGVRTGSSRLDLPHAQRARREKVFPGGDKDKATLLLKDPIALRKLFMSTAYWNPNVRVWKNGKASVTFDLPDNLTTYRVMAVVTDETSRAGSADNQVVVRKPLMIQPVLPRFVYPDDELQVEARVFNQTDKAGVIWLSGKFDGLECSKGARPQYANVEANMSSSFRFPVTVTGKKEAVIRFTAQLGQETDGVEVKVPILGPGTKRTAVASKSISDAGSLSVTLPAERIPGSVQLEVVTSTTALSELKDSVQYLMRYPNGCIEQTTSTAYPLVVLKDLLPEIGVEVNQADLKRFSEAGIRRILSFQTPSGGLSYWPGGAEPHAFGTAFGLTALIEAKKKGYDVPDEALKGMADYLEASLLKGDITNEMPHRGMPDADTRALFVMTLGRLGRPQPGYIEVLWRQREKLTPFGLSFLALAVKEMAGEQALLESILAEIRKASQEKEEEAYFIGWHGGGWSLGSPLRSHGAALTAFASIGMPNGVTSKLLTGLLNRRKYGLWGNTQENVFGIMGVHAAVTQKSGVGIPLMKLTVFNRTVQESEMETLSGSIRRLILREPDLELRDGHEETRSVMLKNSGNQPIFLTIRAQYNVPLDETNRQAQSQGFTFTRHYETLAGESLEGKPIPLGTLVRVRLQIRTDATHHYVAIDDKLPAGLEPLNTSLKTTEKVSMGKFSEDIQRSLSVLSYQEVRDSRVAFYVDEMLPGRYEYVYIARATTPGRFLRPAGRVEAMYQPDIHGTTSIDEVIVNTTTN